MRPNQDPTRGWLGADYRECTPTVGTRVRLVVTGWPKGITPAVAEFTVFGEAVAAR